ncbi:polycomb group RING finger protein 1 isoform X1 [Octopus bimaculoides]|uniref:RING-type domain-containing protein n=2 Tax=Octopus bimaculoides TaxID=37653 RepID=A0A0L8GLG9_OCTBM|nr:polycomb group RING finger protein 1 isoform X1 [Octopus bimaculoides]|eukprot:XP_014780034.1 PREDICTED: polycomb group RING finger protein 1-like isoform X1 [Octopus bimaculoides]
MEEMMKIRIRQVNPHIVCSLCAGYFIDATTITECLHTFCKSCIVKYLQSSKCCPHCNMKIHETQPLANLRADRTLQDIVYKLVPGLFENEEKRREEFYNSRGLGNEKKDGDENTLLKPSTIINHPDGHQYRFDEQICLCLERYGPQSIQNGSYQLRPLEKKFVRCSIRVLVSQVKGLLRKKLSLPEYLDLDVLCQEEKLMEEMSMKQLFLMHWFQKDSPMVLFYRLKQRYNTSTECSS